MCLFTIKFPACLGRLTIFNPLTTKRRLLFVKNPVRTAQKTVFVSVIKTNQFMM